MKLNILERMMALGVLPPEGDYATLKILNQLRLALAFSEKEMKDFGITTDAVNNRTTWKSDSAVEIPMGEKATDIIIEALKALNKEKKLSADSVSLYEKFIPSDD